MKRTITTPRLSPGEALSIHRRRSGATQAEAAKKFKVKLYQYIRWESGVVPTDREGKAMPIPVMRSITWAKLSPAEQCVVARLRSGQSRIDVAASLGVSCTWLSAMEHGRVGCEKLLRYWGLSNEPRARAA